MKPSGPTPVKSSASRLSSAAESPFRSAAVHSMRNASISSPGVRMVPSPFGYWCSHTKIIVYLRLWWQEVSATMRRVDAELGLRERKKKQTRQVIAETALRLFNERGFDSVTVAQVARAADVSDATVFNYFPTKESLFFGQMQTFEEALVQAVGERRVGESVLAAFRRFIDERSQRLATEDAAVAISMAG